MDKLQITMYKLQMRINQITNYNIQITNVDEVKLQITMYKLQIRMISNCKLQCTNYK